jgi:hypothetical protein
MNSWDSLRSPRDFFVVICRADLMFNTNAKPAEPLVVFLFFFAQFTPPRLGMVPYFGQDEIAAAPRVDSRMDRPVCARDRVLPVDGSRDTV